MSDEVIAATSMSASELELLRMTFRSGRFEGVLEEHEGATQTFLYEVPDGHVGLSIGIAPGKGDVHLSVSRWEKQQHHEIEGRWVWVRVNE